MSKITAAITGVHAWLPETILSNADLEKMINTTDEWILQRTGIKERRVAGEDEAVSDMGIKAAKNALLCAEVNPAQVDFLIVCTMTPDHFCPSTGAIIQAAIGADNAAAVDIQAACTGFLYGLSMAKAYVESGMYRNVLVVATEKMSSVTDYTDRSTCILFGDGAAAAVVSGEGAGLSLDHLTLGSDGSQAGLIVVPAGGSRMPSSQRTVDERLQYVRLEGKEVFKHAVRRMAGAARYCLAAAGISDEEIKWLVPHQANLRIIEALARALSFPDEKIYKTVHKYGNTSASSVAIALDELWQEKVLAQGDRVLLVAFGGGLTWGGILMTKIDA